MTKTPRRQRLTTGAMLALIATTDFRRQPCAGELERTRRRPGQRFRGQLLIPTGTVERLDPTTGSWIQMEHPAEGGGMDYLGRYLNVQELPKGKAVRLRYRIALDASMNAGEGGLSATAVTPEPLVQLGRAELPFTVVK